MPRGGEEQAQRLADERRQGPHAPQPVERVGGGAVGAGAALGGLEVGRHAVDQARLAGPEHPSEHAHEVGLGDVALQVATDAARRAGAHDDAPLLELAEQHRDRALGQREQLLQFAGGERDVAQVQDGLSLIHISEPTRPY